MAAPSELGVVGDAVVESVSGSMVVATPTGGHTRVGYPIFTALQVAILAGLLHFLGAA